MSVGRGISYTDTAFSGSDELNIMTSPAFSFFVKVEYTKDRWDKLYELHQNRTKIEFSVKRGNDTQTRNGRISQMQNGAGYDEIETVLFQIDILP